MPPRDLRLKLLTLVPDPETGLFPEDPLDNLPGVVSVQTQFYTDFHAPHLLVIVLYRQEPVTPARPPATSPPPLSGSENETFQRLRSWRRARAVSEGVQAYVVLTDKVLQEISRRRPSSLTKLRDLPGMGDAKVARYGTDILAVLVGEPIPPQPPTSELAPANTETDHE